METVETLRVGERAALLDRLSTALESDPRVVAAWLWGSFGRGEEDAWSDLDVWIVLRDEAYSPALRHGFPAILGEALFTVEAPQNGPSGGTYLMSAHDAPSGPHLVDWYVQPLAFAQPGDSRAVLVDRAEWPSQPRKGPPDGLVLPSEGEAANKAALFWAMALIQAKHIARRPLEPDLGFEGFLLTLMREAAETHDLRDIEGGFDRLDRLRRICARMAEAAPEFAAPREPVQRFLNSVERVLHDPSA